MKIYVCIKQVPDTETRIKLTGDNSNIDKNGIKWIMNPYDEFAVEEALKLKTANAGSTVTVLGLGPKTRIVDSLRTALAMGADDAIAIDAPEDTDSLLTAKALASAIRKEDTPGMIFTGKLAIDDNASAVSQMVAEFLELPHTTVVSKFEHASDKVTVERETEGGTREVVEMQSPAVVGANKGLNMPRYASLPGIMKAKKKPVKDLSLSDLDLGDTKNFVSYTNFELPKEKPACKMIDGDMNAQCAELTKLLREEAKVI